MALVKDYYDDIWLTNVLILLIQCNLLQVTKGEISGKISKDL